MIEARVRFLPGRFEVPPGAGQVAVDEQEIGHLHIPVACVAVRPTAPCGLLFISMTNEVT